MDSNQLSPNSIMQLFINVSQAPLMFHQFPPPHNYTAIKALFEALSARWVIAWRRLRMSGDWPRSQMHLILSAWLRLGLNMSDGELLSTFQVFFLFSFDCTWLGRKKTKNKSDKENLDFARMPSVWILIFTSGISQHSFFCVWQLPLISIISISFPCLKCT